MENRKERAGILYGFKTPALEDRIVEGGDTVTLGKDGDARPRDHRFIPMLVSGREDKLILTPRDAITLGFQAYSDDRSQGVVNGLVLNLKERFVLIPTLAVKLGEISFFPR